MKHREIIFFIWIKFIIRFSNLFVHSFWSICFHCNVWLWAKFKMVSNWFENGLEIKEKNKQKKKEKHPPLLCGQKASPPPLSIRPEDPQTHPSLYRAASRPAQAANPFLSSGPSTCSSPRALLSLPLSFLSPTRGPCAQSRWRLGPARQSPFSSSTPSRVRSGLCPGRSTESALQSSHDSACPSHLCSYKASSAFPRSPFPIPVASVYPSPACKHRRHCIDWRRTRINASSTIVPP